MTGEAARQPLDAWGIVGVHERVSAGRAQCVDPRGQEAGAWPYSESYEFAARERREQ